MRPTGKKVNEDRVLLCGIAVLKNEFINQTTFIAASRAIRANETVDVVQTLQSDRE